MNKQTKQSNQASIFPYEGLCMCVCVSTLIKNNIIIQLLWTNNLQIILYNLLNNI